MPKMMLGYIAQNNLELNPQLTDKFTFRKAPFTRKINSRGDMVYSKMLLYPVDYDDVKSAAETMRESKELILVREPFLLDDELEEKVTKWVEWANKAKPSEYDPFSG